MELGGVASGKMDLFGRKELKEGRDETDKQRIRREQEEAHAQKANRLELNPNLRKPAQSDPPSQGPTGTAPKVVGDGGVAWLKRAFKRAQEQALAEGKSLEEIAEKRWGSLEQFHKLLAKAEGKSASSQQQPQQPTSKQERLREFQRRRSKSPPRQVRPRSRSRSRSRDRNRRRSRSREREESQRYRRHSKDRHERRRSSDRRRHSRSRSRDRRRRHRRSSSSSSSSSSSRDRRRRGHERGKNERRFARPVDDDGEGSGRPLDRNPKSQTSNRAGGGLSSSWKTKDRMDRERQEVRDQIQKDQEKSERKRSRSSSGSASSGEDEKKNEKKTPAPVEEEAVPLLSDKELNALGAKIIKAEMLGNEELLAKLKLKMSKAQEAKAKYEAAKAEGGGDGSEQREETVVLTRTDAKGMTRPLNASEIPEAGGSGGSSKRRKKEKVATHGNDGQRDRYFADDDRYDLKQMFEREKLSTAEDQNGMMSRLAGKALDKTNEDYDLDDVFTDRAARKERDGKAEERARDKAIAEHHRMSKRLDDCKFCLGTKSMQKHLMIAMGRSCYLALPHHTSLTEGHCFIVPNSHTSCATMLDEDVWSEMQEFRKALVRMFAQDDLDCVFFESAMGLKFHPHMILECVPIPRESGDMAPMYFQKAIQECESEWSHNVKLIKLGDKKSIRRAVPKGLPYFHVDFGLQDGFAHVVEDEKEFSRNFAQGEFDMEPMNFYAQEFQEFPFYLFVSKNFGNLKLIKILFGGETLFS